MIIYLMVHLPFPVFWKIGFAHDNPFKRAAALDKEVWGFFVPICFIVVPFAYRMEQAFHRRFKSLKVRFYKGNGSTETYWFPAAIPALVVMLLVWAAYLWAAGRFFGFDGLKFWADFLKAIIHPKETALFCLNDFKEFLKKLLT